MNQDRRGGNENDAERTKESRGKKAIRVRAERAEQNAVTFHLVVCGSLPSYVFGI